MHDIKPQKESTILQEYYEKEVKPVKERQERLYLTEDEARSLIRGIPVSRDFVSAFNYY